MRREISTLTRTRLAQRQREDLMALLLAWPIDGRWRTAEGAIQEARLNTPLRTAFMLIAGGGGEINARLLKRALDRLAGKSLVGRVLQADGRAYRLASTHGPLRLPTTFPRTPKPAVAGVDPRDGHEAEYERRYVANRAKDAARATVVLYRSDGERRARSEAIASGKVTSLDDFRARRPRRGDEPPPTAA